MFVWKRSEAIKTALNAGQITGLARPRVVPIAYATPCRSPTPAHSPWLPWQVLSLLLLTRSTSVAPLLPTRELAHRPPMPTQLLAVSLLCVLTCRIFADTSIAHVNSTLFPPESVVGFPGVTQTGIEAAQAQTAPSYPYNTGAAKSWPLVWDQPHNAPALGDKIDITRYWGNLSPWYSVSSADYGLPDASPLIPQGCKTQQVHLLYRHGARYPTSGAAPATFASKLRNATRDGGFRVTGELGFLSEWTYKLGAELLTPLGRSQSFNLGIEYRQLYGDLLNNFTEQKTLPVFRTQSQDRMVKTAENFAAGFFGVPEYLDQVNIEILVEAPGFNNSGASYYTCNNSNIATRGSIGSTAATKFAANAFNATLARLNSQVSLLISAAFVHD